MKSFKPPYIRFASTNLHTNLTRTRARLLTFRAPPLSVPATYANRLLRDYSFLSSLSFPDRRDFRRERSTKGSGFHFCSRDFIVALLFCNFCNWIGTRLLFDEWISVCRLKKFREGKSLSGNSITTRKEILEYVLKYD